MIILLADVTPVQRPISPPRKMPAIEKKVYAAMSPTGVGLISGDISGMASISRFLVSRSSRKDIAAKKYLLGHQQTSRALASALFERPGKASLDLSGLSRRARLLD